MKEKPLSTRELVFREIRSRIINLTYLPGSIISETELANQLQVSRTPVREALVLLNQHGLVEVFPKKGTFVTKIDMQTVRVSQFIREAIELASLSTLAGKNEKLDSSLMHSLEENLAQQEIAAAKNSTQDFFTLDEEFHEILLSLAGHGLAWAAIENAKLHLDRARILGFQEANPPSEYFQQHCSIYEKISAQDFSSAYELLRSHLRTVFDDSEIAQNSLPEFFQIEEKDGGAQRADTSSRPPQGLNKNSVRAIAKIRSAKS